MKFVRDMNLPMKIVEAEHLFGGERIVVYFSSGGRVDFRDLVRRLAKEYQTRIELRQVGSRDEARLISDFESCGQECCCRRFLKILDPVNMRMAKLQKATLDPSKISGHCGRLKCCLRYEDEIYKILKEQMPRKNSWSRRPCCRADL
jgi:cell fate regulator YaaT (PSP1 superfamily)